MRLHQILCGVAAAGLMAFPAAAQDARYAAALARIMDDARAGNCSELMSAGVQLACQRRIEAIAATLERFGPVQNITLISSEERSGGLVETYEVGFTGGYTMIWVIGGLSDGQFHTAYSDDA